jgi:hypothetical protein
MLNQLLTAHIMLRRLKKDVLGEIPPLQRSRISVLPDPKNLKALSAHPALLAQMLWPGR